MTENKGPEIQWPATDQEWCAWYLRLDAKHNTDKRSPLHHDNHCPVHFPHGREGH